jgi:hypothetical protein
MALEMGTPPTALKAAVARPYYWRGALRSGGEGENQIRLRPELDVESVACGRDAPRREKLRPTRTARDCFVLHVASLARAGLVSRFTNLGETLGDC